MAFTASTFIPLSAMANSNAPRMFSYLSAADNLAALKAAAYFDDAAVTTGGLGLKNGDVIMAKATDGMSFLEIAVAANGDTTLTSANDFA